MEIILLERITNLGKLGDKVTVKSGYGRNFLIPTGKAAYANAKNLANFEGRRAELEKAAGDAFTRAEGRARALEGKTLTIAKRASDEGKLFGSVIAIDIINAAKDIGETIVKQEIRLPNGPIHQVGEYDVDLHLHPEVNTKITVSIVAE